MKLFYIVVILWFSSFSLVFAQAYDGRSIEDIISEIDFSKEGVIVSQQEKDAVIESIHLAKKVSIAAEKKNGLPYRRDAHAKATACLRAEFSVNGDIPKRFQHSIFSEPGKTYRAWIRFSNGDMVVQADKKPDARGMAVKIMGVSGEKIAPELKGPATQDFIMTNTPAFFNRNIYDYVEDMHYIAKLQRTKWFVSLFPPRLHPRQFQRAVQTVSSKINTPLNVQYYSMLPYQLGQTNLKFSMKVCDGMTFDEKPDTNNFDYLTKIMQERLTTQGACFDFMLQPKVAGANMPLDDATVIWSEKASPFIPVARLQIPPQTFTSEEQMNFCENITMNPWHGVGEWLPQGSLNRARRMVYHAVSAFRHEKNQAKTIHPINWCLDGNKDCDNAKTVNVKKSKWPLPRCFDKLYQPLDGKEVESVCEKDDKEKS